MYKDSSIGLGFFNPTSQLRRSNITALYAVRKSTSKVKQFGRERVLPGYKGKGKVMGYMYGVTLYVIVVLQC